MRILMIGDVVGGAGRRTIGRILPKLRAQYGVDLVIANGENAAGGWGLTEDTARELFAAGVDCITSGNHIWREKGVLEFLEQEEMLLRPLNYPAGTPGKGWVECKGVLVVNLEGRTFMKHIDCPFRGVDRLLSCHKGTGKAIVVDFHAEATSEKMAMGWHLAGRVSAVLGTHTHVPTADARVLPGGTAYVTDAGMVGPRDSIIGVEIKPVLSHFITRLPVRFSVAKGPVIFNSVLVDVDSASGLAREISRVDLVDGGEAAESSQG